MKSWTKEEVDGLSGPALYRASVEAGVYKVGMSAEEVRVALVNPIGEIPDWGKKEESKIEKLLRKLMDQLPEPIRFFLEGIEFDEVFLSLIVQVVDNAFERRTYVTKEELAAKMSEFSLSVNDLVKSQGTPGNEDNIAAEKRFQKFSLQWWLDPVGSKPVQKK